MVLASLSERFGDSSIAFFHLIRLKGRRCWPRMHGLNQPIKASPAPQQCKARFRRPVVRMGPSLMLYCIVLGMWLSTCGYWRRKSILSAMLIFELDGSRVIIGAVASHSSGCPVLKEDAAVVPIWPSVKRHTLEASVNLG